MPRKEPGTSVQDKQMYEALRDDGVTEPVIWPNCRPPDERNVT